MGDLFFLTSSILLIFARDFNAERLRLDPPTDHFFASWPDAPNVVSRSLVGRKSYIIVTFDEAAAIPHFDEDAPALKALRCARGQNIVGVANAGVD